MERKQTPKIDAGTSPTISNIFFARYFHILTIFQQVHHTASHKNESREKDVGCFFGYLPHRKSLSAFFHLVTQSMIDLPTSYYQIITNSAKFHVLLVEFQCMLILCLLNFDHFEANLQSK